MAKSRYVGPPWRGNREPAARSHFTCAWCGPERGPVPDTRKYKIPGQRRHVCELCAESHDESEDNSV